jgi:hypothetical protein
MKSNTQQLINFDQSIIIGFYLLSATVLQSCASNHKTSYRPLTAVDFSHHCEINPIDNRQSLMPSELKLLENKQRVKDETTIALMLKSAAINIAEQSESKSVCQQTFTQGTALFQKIIKQNQQKLASEKGFEPAKEVNILAAQKRITDLWRADQSARATLVSLPSDNKNGVVFWANRLASARTIRVDNEATEYLEKLLQQYDWIDQQRFGNSVSAHAWILIQHADDRVDLQAEVLERMHPYFVNGGIRPANYAYLWDRVAVNRGHLQRYGTQPIWKCEQGQLQLQPIEDMDQANLLRKKIGMNSVQAGLDEMAAAVCANH